MTSETEGQTATMPSEHEVMQALKAVYDPELAISIVDLGLVYGVQTLDDDADRQLGIVDSLQRLHHLVLARHRGRLALCLARHRSVPPRTARPRWFCDDCTVGRRCHALYWPDDN